MLVGAKTWPSSAQARERADAYLGRKPPCDRKEFEALVNLFDLGIRISALAMVIGLSWQAIHHIRDVPTEAAFARWSR